MTDIIVEAMQSAFFAAVLIFGVGFTVYFAAVLVRAGLVEWRLQGIYNRNRLDEAITEQRARLERERAAESARIDAEVRRVLAERNGP